MTKYRNLPKMAELSLMQNHKLLTLWVIENKRDFILTFGQKVIKETNITINGKNAFFGA